MGVDLQNCIHLQYHTYNDFLWLHVAVIAESQAAGYDESHRDKTAESKLSHHVAQSPVTAWLLMWSGEANQRNIRGPVNSSERNQNIKIKRFTQEQFFTWFLIPHFFYIGHLKAENTTVSAANLCPGVCSSDVVNKASACGRSTKYVMGQPFSALHWWRVKLHCVKQKCTSFVRIAVEQSNEMRSRKYFAQFLRSRPACTFGSFPFKDPYLTHRTCCCSNCHIVTLLCCESKIVKSIFTFSDGSKWIGSVLGTGLNKTATKRIWHLRHGPHSFTDLGVMWCEDCCLLFLIRLNITVLVDWA